MRRASGWSWWNETRAIAQRRARGASDAADDLAQDLAVAALERGGRVERVGAWLERVGRNAEIDRWRAEDRRRQLVTDVDVPVAPADPEQRLLAGERREIVRRELAALPRPLRRAALARFAAELPFEDVAARLGTEPVTARTRVHRALARLRARVGGLRAMFVLGPGAQATVLGVALVAGVARPVAPPAETAVSDRAPGPAVPARRVAVEPAAAVHVAAPPPVPAARPHPAARAARPAASAPEPIPPAVQRIPFEDDFVSGEHDGPDGPVVAGEPRIKHLSLIEIRWHFVAEVVKSFEDL